MTPRQNLLRVEFHCHTIFSKDSLVTPDELVSVCRAKRIDRVVVTDHNTIAGALAAQEIDPELVIVGEEIMTQKGELLAAFVRRLRLERAATRLRMTRWRLLEVALEAGYDSHEAFSRASSQHPEATYECGADAQPTLSVKPGKQHYIPNKGPRGAVFCADVRRRR